MPHRRTCIDTIEVGNEPTGVAVAGGRALVTATGDNELDLISTSTNKVSDTVEVGRRPTGVAVDPGDFENLYVSNSGSDNVSHIDVPEEGAKVIRNFPVGDEPTGIDLSPDGRLLYVANSRSDDVSVLTPLASP